jgi:hypothetical protein
MAVTTRSRRTTSTARSNRPKYTTKEWTGRRAPVVPDIDTELPLYLVTWDGEPVVWDGEYVTFTPE